MGCFILTMSFIQGASTSRDCDKDVYITQIVHLLESLHMSAVVNTRQLSLADCISNASTAQESTTCCSQTKSSEVLKQRHKSQLRMLSHRWQRLGLQPPILWDKQEHISQHKLNADARLALEAHPIQINCVESTKNKPPEKIKTIRSSICSNKHFINKHPKGNATKQSVPVESENSDLSDQEKGNVPTLKWNTSVELDLRPDSFDRDVETIETEKEEQVYSEVLPFLLKDLESSHHSESQLNDDLTDSCLAAMAARMINLEKLQTATIQKEQGKAIRSRPVTALVRSANRLRRLESPCSQVEHLKTKANNLFLDDITKLSKSMHRNHLSPNEFQQPPALPKKPHSGAVKLKKTEALVQDVVVHAGVSPKCNCPNNSKRCKTTKKPLRTSYEKSNVPAKALSRKT